MYRAFCIYICLTKKYKPSDIAIIYFTADYHLSHKNIIKYCNRPFKTIDEMNAIILDNLVKNIVPGDMLYILGDLTFDKKIAKDFFELLKDAEIHFVVGNHDSSQVIKICQKYCASVSRLKNIIIEDQPITLCHYAMRVWDKSHFNSWQLYGHSHGNLDDIGKQYDVGVDVNNFLPVPFAKIIERMETKADNFNYISSDNLKKGVRKN